jgi:hypothetical protein
VTPAAALRSFHSSRPVANTITVEERKGPTGTIVATPGIIDQYGTIPFVGLLATALITKEVFIFDEGALLALNTAAVITTAYIGIGNSADAFFEGERTKDNNRYHDTFNAVLEQVNLYKSVEAKKLQKVGVIKDLCRESREVNAAYLKFLDVKKRHEARTAMVSKLETIKKRESQEEAAEYQEAITDAIEGVRAVYLDLADPDSAALRSASLEFAINNIGDVQEGAEDDPVRQVLYDFLDAGDELDFEAASA